MSEEPSRDYVRKPWLLMRRTEQFVIGSCVLFCLIAMAACFIQQQGLRGRIIEIDRADPMTVQFKVDINTAGWPELTQLPNVGETLARRIVKFRQRNGPFTSVEHLHHVDGIGPKTIEQIRPYLLPLHVSDKVAGVADEH